MFQENSHHIYPNIDYDCLRIYDENNKHFSMAVIREKQKGEAIGYDCIYRFGTHRIKLEFDLTSGLWETIPLESYEQEEHMLHSSFHGIEFLTLDQQIQIIIKHYDQHFAEIDQRKNEGRYENKISVSASIFKDENGIKCINNEFIELTPHPTPTLTIPDARPKSSGLAPPPVAPRRSRQNSACSTTQSSVRYASFIPTPTAPVPRRRVVESILLNVQRKKKTFEKIIDVLTGTQSPTMSQLGLQFLRVYDGKFNYRVGHTFVISFRKKTWFLTIEQIKCVDCPVGDIEPRSELILCYEGQYTSVHV